METGISENDSVILCISIDLFYLAVAAAARKSANKLYGQHCQLFVKLR
jgi:hypothetical protein